MAHVRLVRRPSVAGLVLGAVVVAGCASGDSSVQDPGDTNSATSVAGSTAPSSAPSPAAPSTSAPPATATPSPAPTTPDTPLPTAVLPSPGTDLPPPTGGASMSPDLQVVVDAAIADLHGRLATADAGDVEVLVAREETFPNGALGCPKEGEMVTQALVEGYRVVLRRADRVWLYTAPEDGQPRLCPSEDKDGGHGFVPPPGIDD